MLLFSSLIAAAAIGKTIPPIIPQPVDLKVIEAAPFEFTSATTISNPSNFKSVKFLSSMLGKAPGLSIKNGQGKTTVKFVRIQTFVESQGMYTMHIRPREITIEASEESGAYYAIQTLRQLLPNQIESDKKVSGVHWSVPSLDIFDKPRFEWRGMHLDVSRHFFSVDFIKRYIDWIAMHKMNVFHWHLIDDGGWRIESKKYPLLTKKGAFRTGDGDWGKPFSFVDDPKGQKMYGGFYTQEQIKDVVKYASERSVTVVPEIEMPGHNSAAVASYPWLNCELEKPPVNNVFCPGDDKALKFCTDILDETMELFPSKFIHIGADEVDKSNWRLCPDCQKRMKAEGINNVNELQSWFVRYMDKYLESKGRRLVGWDEILEGGLAPGATVMSWRGISGGIEAAKQGKNVVMSPTSHCYFDFSYETTPTEKVYNFEPIPAELSEKEGKLVLGGQANVWTEWIATEERCEYMIFPRMTALAESLWTPKAKRNYENYRTRLIPYYGRLDALKVNYQLMTPAAPEFNALIFKGKTTVSMKTDPTLPFVLRYTTDGSIPNGKSPAYKGPITVTKDTDFVFAYVNPVGQAGNTVRISTAKYKEVGATGFNPGINFDVFEGRFSKVPDFSKLKPVKSGLASAISVAPMTREEEVALHFTGYLAVDEPGIYEFSLSSDDGSWLKVGGAMVVDNDGLHGADVKTGKVKLDGGMYTFEVGFFEQGGAQSLNLAWKKPKSTQFVKFDDRLFRKP